MAMQAKITWSQYKPNILSTALTNSSIRNNIYTTYSCVMPMYVTYMPSIQIENICVHQLILYICTLDNIVYLPNVNITLQHGNIILNYIYFLNSHSKFRMINQISQWKETLNDIEHWERHQSWVTQIWKGQLHWPDDSIQIIVPTGRMDMGELSYLLQFVLKIY